MLAPSAPRIIRMLWGITIIKRVLVVFREDYASTKEEHIANVGAKTGIVEVQMVEKYRRDKVMV